LIKTLDLWNAFARISEAIGKEYFITRHVFSGKGFLIILRHNLLEGKKKAGEQREAKNVAL
jgi:hypothetical protein